MSKILLFLITLTVMKISYQQGEGDDDNGLNPYPLSLLTIDCQSLPHFFNPDTLNNLNRNHGCPFKVDCAEITNQDSSRSHLYQFFRMHSKQLVLGTCPNCTKTLFILDVNIRYSNIFLMRQNWFLEYSAHFLFSTHGCPFEMNGKILPESLPPVENHDLGTLPDITTCEYYFAVTSMKIEQKQKQEDAAANFVQSMVNNDLLRTWNNSDYMIGSASHYGCAIIIKDGVSGTSARGETLQNDRVAYLACLFVAAIHLVSTRGELNEYSCYLYNGMTQYFSSLETTLCVHNNLALNPAGLVADIACEENFNDSICLDPTTLATVPVTEKSTPRTSKQTTGTSKQTTGTSKQTPENNVRPAATHKSPYTEWIHADDDDIDLFSGIQFFFLLAVIAFFLLAILISVYERYRSSESP